MEEKAYPTPAAEAAGEAISCLLFEKFTIVVTNIKKCQRQVLL